MRTISTTISASQARSNFYTLLDEVTNKLKRITITRRGKAQAVLMHPDEVEAWEETMEILADKKLVKEIFESEKEFKAGKGISHEDLIKELGLNSEDIASND